MKRTNGFARDIQRYLEGDPVEACPPSASYKLRKFARKAPRGPWQTAGAFALLLVAARLLERASPYGRIASGARAVSAEKRGQGAENASRRA